MMHFAALLPCAALVGPPRVPVRGRAAPVTMADSGPIAQALKELKTKYEVPWLAEGDGSPMVAARLLQKRARLVRGTAQEGADLKRALVILRATRSNSPDEQRLEAAIIQLLLICTIGG